MNRAWLLGVLSWGCADVGEDALTPGVQCWVQSGTGTSALQVTRIDMGSGEIVERVEAPGDLQSAWWRGMGRIDDRWIAADPRGVRLFDLVTGEVQTAALPEEQELLWVFADTTFVVVARRDQEVIEYARIDELDDLADAEWVTLHAWASSFGADGAGGAFGAWHSTDTIEHYAPNGALVADVPLDGFDGWVYGISGVGGVLYVLSSWNGPTRLMAFDAQTGASLGEFRYDLLMGALHCEPAP